jgi:hypothetical protein
MRYALTRDNVIRLRDTLKSIDSKEDAHRWASQFVKAMVSAFFLT